MPKRLNFPDDIKIGAPFSNMVVDDDYVFLAGLVAADVEEGMGILGDIREETAVVMNTVRLLLGKVGLEMSDIVRSDVHLTDLGDMDAMNEIYAGYFEDGRFPARTTTQSGALFGGSKVEVTVMARRR